MPSRAIYPGWGRKGAEAKMLCRPLARATSRLVGVLRYGWRRAMARILLTLTDERGTVGSDDDDDPIDEMAVW